jgi:hypothetical protein
MAVSTTAVKVKVGARQCRGGNQAVCKVIPVAVIVQQDPLAALPDIAKGWVGRAKADLCRRGAVSESEQLQDPRAVAYSRPV